MTCWPFTKSPDSSNPARSASQSYKNGRPSERPPLAVRFSFREKSARTGSIGTLLRTGVWFHAALGVAGRQRPEQKAPQVRSHPAEDLRCRFDESRDGSAVSLPVLPQI